MKDYKIGENNMKYELTYKELYDLAREGRIKTDYFRYSKRRNYIDINGEVWTLLNAV